MADKKARDINVDEQRVGDLVEAISAAPVAMAANDVCGNEAGHVELADRAG